MRVIIMMAFWYFIKINFHLAWWCVQIKWSMLCLICSHNSFIFWIWIWLIASIASNNVTIVNMIQDKVSLMATITIAMILVKKTDLSEFLIRINLLLRNKYLIRRQRGSLIKCSEDRWKRSNKKWSLSFIVWKSIGFGLLREWKLSKEMYPNRWDPSSY